MKIPSYFSGKPMAVFGLMLIVIPTWLIDENPDLFALLTLGPALIIGFFFLFMAVYLIASGK